MMGVPPYAAELSESVLAAMDLDLETQVSLEEWLPNLTEVAETAKATNLRLLKKAATFTLGGLMLPLFRDYVTAHELPPAPAPGPEPAPEL